MTEPINLDALERLVHDEEIRARVDAGILRRVIAELRASRKVVEATRELAEIIERFRPLDAAFGSPSPFRLIEDAQDKLRAALAELEVPA